MNLSKSSTHIARRHQQLRLQVKRPSAWQPGRKSRNLMGIRQVSGCPSQEADDSNGIQAVLRVQNSEDLNHS